MHCQYEITTTVKQQIPAAAGEETVRVQCAFTMLIAAHHALSV